MTDTASLALHAKTNFHRHLVANPYPGRGIIVGLDETGENLIQVYWIMGRSPNSQNRVFSKDHDRVFTEAADPSKVKDPSLIIYNAMREYGEACVVSNGSQTDTVIDRLREPIPYRCLYTALEGVEYEPDAPNFTPRITAVCGWMDMGARRQSYVAEMSMLRKSAHADDCDHILYEFGALGHGFGYCVTTYLGNGDPLPAFRGEPLLMPLVGNLYQIGETYWAALNDTNKVSLVVKAIPRKGAPQVHIINKYSKVGA